MKKIVRIARRIEAQCICRCCRKEFWLPVANVRKGMGQYCSRPCAGKASSGHRGEPIKREIVTRVVETPYVIYHGARR